MGSWGTKAFESDAALDFVGAIVIEIMKPIDRVNRTKSDRSAAYHYDSARAAALSLLALSKVTGLVEVDEVESAAAALIRMLNDKAFIHSYNSPAKVNESINADISLVAIELARLRKERERRVRAVNKMARKDR